jgi:outer membrane protein TolC
MLAAAVLVACGSAPAWAGGTAAADWRAANDLVGGFPRGHSDLVQWEAQHLPAPAAPADAAAAGAPRWTLADALRAAQRARPELLARPGLNPLELAELRGKHAELALQVERAWIKALAARRAVAVAEAELGATQAGAELAARMVRVGNWPAVQSMQQQLLVQQAQAQQRVALHQARAAELDLWRLAGAGLSPQQLAARLPPAVAPAPAGPDPATLDAAALEAQALQAHPQWRLREQQARQAELALDAASQRQLAATLDAATAAAQAGAAPALPALAPQQLWPHAWAEAARARAQADALQRQIRADLRSALGAWQTAAALAEGAGQQQQLHAAIHDDTQQRYNGMLKSTFDLLASARARLQAEQAALLARREAELAHAELRAVLAGLPYTGTAPGAAPAAAGAAAPH